MTQCFYGICHIRSPAALRENSCEWGDLLGVCCVLIFFFGSVYYCNKKPLHRIHMSFKTHLCWFTNPLSRPIGFNSRMVSRAGHEIFLAPCWKNYYNLIGRFCDCRIIWYMLVLLDKAVCHCGHVSPTQFWTVQEQLLIWYLKLLGSCIEWQIFFDN